MKVKLSDEFIEQYKKADVRIQHAVDEKLRLFIKNSLDSRLHNHTLRAPLTGKRSINITADWRAIYEEIIDDPQQPSVFFTSLGTHAQLYK